MMRWLAMVASLSIGFVTIGCPDERFSPANIDYSTSTITEANLRWDVEPDAGNIASPAGIPYASPVALGTASTYTSLTVDVLDPGSVLYGAGTYTYTVSSVERGRSPLGVYTGTETVGIAAAGPSYEGYYPSGVVLPDGSVGIAYYGLNEAIRYRRRTAPNTFGSVVSVRTFSAGPTVDPQPVIWQVYSDGSTGAALYVGYWDELDANNQRFRYHQSLDGGATWTDYIDTNLTHSTASYDYTKTQVVWDEITGNLIMIVWRSTFPVDVYRSTDLGRNWTQLTGATISDDVLAWDVTSQCGVVHLLWVQDDTTDNVYHSSKGFDEATTWASTNLFTTDTGSEVGITSMPDGRLMGVYGLPGYMLPIYSIDGGSTWSATTGGIHNLGDSTPTVSTHIRDMLYTTGQVLFVGDMLGSSTKTQTTVIHTFGEESNINVSHDSGILDYYPVEIPTTLSTYYTYSGTSAQAINDSSDQRLVYEIDNTNDTGYHSVLTVGGPSNIGWVWKLSGDSAGGSTASDAIALRVQSKGAGATDAAAELRIDATNKQAQFYDVIGAANLGTVKTWTATNVEFMVAVNQASAKASAWYRNEGDVNWTAIATNQTVVATGTLTADALFGKISASTANVSFLYWYAFEENGHATNTQEVMGISASGRPDFIRPGAALKWIGSPLMAGDSWTLETVSQSSFGRVFPWSTSPSASLKWTSAVGSAARSERAVVTFDADYKGKLSHNLIHLAADNTDGVDTITIDRWTGAAWSTIMTLTLGTSQFGASVAWTRDSSTSTVFRPNGANGNPTPLLIDELKGKYISFTDGVDTIIARVKRNDPGQFSTSSGALQASIEIDPDTIVAVAGAFSTLAQSATGTVKVYQNRGMIVGTQADECTTKYSFNITLAPGITQASIGALSCGPAYVLARPERDGSSMRFDTPFRMSSLPNGIAWGRQYLRAGARSLELPYDQILVRDYQYAGGGVVETGNATGATVRFQLDNNVDTISQLAQQFGNAAPVAVSLTQVVASDWGTSAQVAYGANVIQGWIGAPVDYVNAKGQLFARSGNGSYGGIQLGIVENI